MRNPDHSTIIHLWGAKGGVGTSTVAAVVALHLARRQPVELRANDTAGLNELRAILGIPAGEGPVALGREHDGHTAVVIDGGTDPQPPPDATASFLVTRACYLAIRRALAAGARPRGIVLIAEPERSLCARDIEDVLDADVIATIPVSPTVARAVDAGLIAARPPRFPLDALLSSASE